MAVYYYEEGIKARLADRRRLSAFLKDLVSGHLSVARMTLSYIFCSDEYLLEKNRQFLRHDTLTDIITFDLSETDNELTGEIYISVERVAENAAKFGVAYNTELHRVIFHGALHLCGFKDKKKEDKALMTEMEDACLRKYFSQS